jgi:hypothetical protein
MVLHTIVFAVNKHRSGTSLHPNKICAERERERVKYRARKSSTGNIFRYETTNASLINYYKRKEKKAQSQIKF